MCVCVCVCVRVVCVSDTYCEQHIHMYYIRTYNIGDMKTVDLIQYYDAGNIDDKMKALKCKTLGGIHMQSTAAMLALCIYVLRMRVRVPRCPE